MQIEIKTMDERIAAEKLAFNVNRDGTNISELSLAKIDNFEYFTGKIIFPLDQNRLVE